MHSYYSHFGYQDFLEEFSKGLSAKRNKGKVCRSRVGSAAQRMKEKLKEAARLKAEAEAGRKGKKDKKKRLYERMCGPRQVRRRLQYAYM